MRKAKLVVTFEQAPSYEVRIGPGVLANLGADIQRAVLHRSSGFDNAGNAIEIGGEGAGAAAGTNRGAAAHASEATASAADTRVLLLADVAVEKTVTAQAKAALAAVGYRPLVVNVSPDEALETAGELWRALAQAHLSDASVVVAVGDAPLLQLAGFVATAYSGGLSCAYVPTTLAAAVAMSVSDRATLDVAGARGLVNAEMHPLFSCIDLDVLAMADSEAWLDGFAGCAQAAFLDSDEFFFWLSDNASALRNRSAEALCEALVRTLGFRSQLSSRVEQGDARALACLSYGRDFSDATGASLAQGMRFSALLSHFKGMISEDIVQAQDALLASLGFVQKETLSVEGALEGLLSFAGRCDGAELMLPVDIGCCERVFVPADELRSCLEALSA